MLLSAPDAGIEDALRESRRERRGAEGVDWCVEGAPDSTTAHCSSTAASNHHYLVKTRPSSMPTTAETTTSPQAAARNG
jgi:hypothetical protein